MDSDPSELTRLRAEAGQVFSPATPIDARDLFAGRARQLQTLLDVVNQRGQHAVVFGERGVGKTSLVNVLPEFIRGSLPALAPSCNCDSTDTFASVWKKLFRRIPVVYEERTMGLRPAVTKNVLSIADELPPEITPDVVVQALADAGQQHELVVILDEFDRLQGGADNRLFADTIKTLSDYAAPVTLVLVGVGDSVDQLVAGHQSVERALVQVHMPRMTDPEIREILLSRLPKLGLIISTKALKQIVTLARGLPHYAHLLGLHAARAALEADAVEVEPAHVFAAVREAVGNASQSIQSLYHKAITSPRKDNLYTQTVLACAVAEPDAQGYFAAADVRGPFNEILMDKSYPVSAFTKHLHDLCDAKRGPLLEKTGDKHRHRFRFTNSLVQPFVLMHGLSTGMISQEQLEDMR